MKSTDVMKAANREGISGRSVWRAKRRLDIRASKQGFGKDGFWLWSLAPSQTEDRGSLSHDTHENPNENAKAAKGCQPEKVAALGDDTLSMPKAATTDVAPLAETLGKPPKHVKAANLAIGEEADADLGHF